MMMTIEEAAKKLSISLDAAMGWHRNTSAPFLKNALTKDDTLSEDAFIDLKTYCRTWR